MRSALSYNDDVAYILTTISEHCIKCLSYCSVISVLGYIPSCPLLHTELYVTLQQVVSTQCHTLCIT